jgi:hypothetical protein
MLELVGEFYQTRGGCFYEQGFENPPKIYPNPLQKLNKPTHNQKWHNPWMGMCLWRLKKMDKKNKFWRSWVWVRKQEKWG